MLPFLPDEKSNQACFWSFTKNDGVLLVERRQALELAAGAHELDAPAHDLRNRKPSFQLVQELGREAHGFGPNRLAAILGPKLGRGGDGDSIPAIPVANIGLR